MIKEDSVIVVAEDLKVATLEGEAVVLDLKVGHYYGVNNTGSLVLELAEQPIPVNEIIEALRHEYEVDAEQLKQDILAFLQDMESKQLIQVDGVASEGKQTLGQNA